MTRIVSTLNGYTPIQLGLLYKLGFCMESTIGVTRGRLHNFGICHGATGPQNSHLTQHITTPAEMDEWSRRLQRIIRLLPTPKHVNVARSTRDGFTPKEFRPYIEWDILTSIKKIFPGYSTVHYDPDLLGGASGWLWRHNPETGTHPGFQLLFSR